MTAGHALAVAAGASCFSDCWADPLFACSAAMSFEKKSPRFLSSGAGDRRRFHVAAKRFLFFDFHVLT
jgi:hypothetical protein